MKTTHHNSQQNEISSENTIENPLGVSSKNPLGKRRSFGRYHDTEGHALRRGKGVHALPSASRRSSWTFSVCFHYVISFAFSPSYFNLSVQRIVSLSLSLSLVILHSAKGGAVETGCSDLYDVIYQFTI